MRTTALILFVLTSSLTACGQRARPLPAPPAAAPSEVVSPDSPARPDVMGVHGAVVAGHPLAAAAGYDVLRRGGNAVDAVVTMAAVLAVVRPHMNGVGGDAFALFYEGGSGKVVALNGSGRAGRLATPEYFAERGIDAMPGSGPLTVTVPGAVSAWAAALERYGRISLAQALEPAIRYAEEGVPVSRTRARDLRGAMRLNEAGRAIYAPGGEPVRVGTLLRNPALATTLRTLAEEGPTAMYGGRIGRAIADFLEKEGGLLRAEDFAQHTATWTEPRSIAYLGRRAHTMPPNSQGAALLQQLAMAETFPLAEMGHNSAEYLHTLIEIKKLAFADRDRWIADPDESPAPLDELLSREYLRDRARAVADRAARDVAPGLGDPIAATTADGDGDTVYLMAVDSDGNAVSWIQSLFSSFGSGLVEPSTGIVLQNRGAGFTLEAGHPNRIAPGKRPFHTLTPVLVTDDDGRLEMTIGTPGGHGQTPIVLQVLNNIYLFGMSPQEAVEAPRYLSHDGLRVSIEDRVPASALRGLSAYGHELDIVSGWTAPFGGAQVIQVIGSPAVLRTGADPRREAYALAF